MKGLNPYSQSQQSVNLAEAWKIQKWNRLWPESASESVTKVGIELLGQLEICNLVKTVKFDWNCEIWLEF